MAYFPGVQLVVLVVHQEEGGAVSLDQLLCLVHHLQDQSVHADHLLEYRPAEITSHYQRQLNYSSAYWTTLRRKLVASFWLETLPYWSM